MSATIKYNNSVVATVDSGEVATLPVKDLKMATNIEVTAIKDAPKLQIKTVTPTKSNQDIVADSNLGYGGLSKVTVGAIPDNYIDTSDATAKLGDILDGKTAYVNGEKIEGEMPNNGYYEGDYFLELDASNPSETLYGAYNGKATITLEEKTITENGTYNASSGKVISKVTVAIPEVPKWSEVADFSVFADEADEGVAELAYNSSKDVKLPAGQRVRFFSLEDDNFVPWNIKNGVTIFGMTGSYKDQADGLADGSVIDLVLPNATKVRQYGFYFNKTLRSIDIPNATSLEKSAFQGCSNLVSINIPNVTTTAYASLGSCTSLVSVNMPKVKSLGSGTFTGCTSLSSVTFGIKLSLPYDNYFANCPNLTTINVPWAEGEVSGAPWGATNATINYNYKG